jgi:predicted secreted hydrolase
MCKKWSLRTFTVAMLVTLGCAGGDAASTAATNSALAANDAACTVQPSLNVNLPADDAPHAPQSTEEWYYNMHLATAAGEHYGVRLAFFQNATLAAPFTAALATLDVTDLNGARPSFVSDTITLPGSVFPRGRGTFSLQVADPSHGDSAHGGDGSDHVTGQIAGYALDLKLDAQKPAVLHADRGLLPLPLGYDVYYSRTRMSVEGTLSLASGAQQVTGIAWFDHQYGASPTVSWQWFSVQLDDGRDLMVYQWNASTGVPEYLTATLAGAECGQQTFDAAQIVLTRLGTWTSPTSGIAYGNAWQLEIPERGLTLQVKPYVESSELVRTAADGGPYLSADCEITGTERGAALHGLGYVEQRVLSSGL